MKLMSSSEVYNVWEKCLKDNLEENMRARRALLYVPGDEIRKIRKATTLDVDCVCLDIEDGVAQSRKAEARSTILTALDTLDFGRAERLVRINPIGSGMEQEDLQAVLSARPDGIVIPKVDDVEQVRWVCAQIDREWGKETPLGVIVIIEAARAIINLAQVASAHSRLRGLIFGAEDFAGDVGAIRTPQAWEVFYARSAVVTHAAAYNLQAIDMVYVDFEDTEGLLQEARFGAQMGFSGKQIIHPNQVGPVQETFTPSTSEIAQAWQVMREFEKHQQAGQGAFAMNGKMIDAPILKAAQRVLERAQAAGVIPAGDS
jgi:citrate lyase beta subunit